MVVLIADSDSRLTALMSRTLEGAGHAVAVAATGAEVRGRLARGDVALVIVDLDLDRGAALGDVGAWRRQGGTGVVLVGSRADRDPAVSRALTDVDADRYLRKPFSLLDIGDLVRKALPAAPRRAATPAPRRVAKPAPAPAPARAPAPAPAKASGVARLAHLDRRAPRRPEPASTRSSSPAPALGGRGLRLLARLWATRSSGVVWVDVDGRERDVRFSDGGPLGRDAALIDAVLRGAPARFELGAAPPGGDAHGLGARLLAVARERADTGYVERHRFDALSRGRWPDAVDRLPLRGGVRAVLDRADGRTTLGAALAGANGDTDAARDIAALAAMGLVTAGAPVAGRPTAGGRRSPGPNSDEPPTVERRVRSRRGYSPTGPTRGNSTRGATTNPSSGTTPDRTAGDRTVTSVSSRQRRGRAGLRSALRRSTRGSGAGRPDTARLYKQLDGERQRLREAAPAVVLGIPAAADKALVDQATARLRARYAGLSQDASNTDAVRAAAAELLQLVQQAHDAMSRRGPTLDDDGFDSFEDRPTDMALAPVASEEERLLELGEQLMARSQWAQADKALTRARDLQLGHPGILAALGWARFHNEERAAADRLDEGRDLLLLAEQFGGSDDPRAQTRLGHVLLAAAEVDKAARRASRAASLAPDDAEVRALQQAVAAAQAAATPES